MLGIVAAAGDAVPRRRRSELELALGQREADERRLPELERAEREVTLGRATAFARHVRLLPQLRELADARLGRTGRRAGPQTLGQWWELLRPYRGPPAHRCGPRLERAAPRGRVS